MIHKYHKKLLKMIREKAEWIHGSVFKPCFVGNFLKIRNYFSHYCLIKSIIKVLLTLQRLVFDHFVDAGRYIVKALLNFNKLLI